MTIHGQRRRQQYPQLAVRPAYLNFDFELGYPVGQNYV